MDTSRCLRAKPMLANKGFLQAKLPVWCQFLGRTSNFMGTTTGEVIHSFSGILTSTSTSCWAHESPTHSFAQAYTPWIIGRIQLLIQENTCSWSSTWTACISSTALVSSLVLQSLALWPSFLHLKHKPFFIIFSFCHLHKWQAWGFILSLLALFLCINLLLCSLLEQHHYLQGSFHIL